MKADISNCSERFLKGIRWFENEMKFDEMALRARLEKIRPESEEHKAKGDFILHQEVEDLNLKLKLRCQWHAIPEAAYVLKRSGSEFANEFIRAAGNDAFWDDDIVYDWRNEDAHEFWFLGQLGLESNPNFADAMEDLTKSQSVEGLVTLDVGSHIGFVRVLVAAGAESKTLSDAIKYWLSNWKSEYDSAKSIAIAILALTELDHQKYSDAIKEESDFLRSIQDNDGSWGEQNIEQTAYSLWALSRTVGTEDSSSQKGLSFLSREQEKNGSWGNRPQTTAYALLGLLAMGEGPKVSMDLVDFERTKWKQRLRRLKPVFLHTSPLYENSLHVKEIHDKVYEMLHAAKNEIRISSPFIDMFYEEIINLKQEKPELTVEIITRPRREAEGIRERIAKNVIDLLRMATRGNMVESPLVHSRMIIVDDKELLVSSADLTRDQLFDEFNAGMWTSDREALTKAIKFFDNFFALEKKKEEASKS